ncbi:peroxisomal biogenesis factor PEX11 [Besnoitia besnoiti]|uniref:Peroxisomal biogenesis factor PEX11 n=1 Tax=Besnoitia besnoiti TaxID=94643 RepID=A0A2A9MBR1_BESBE|nr:peroxisomal biogenesis factor PEX11 [Besnoitia besnoiti]PFH32832.1 peroxisomal biogenesis factor PEX11 [Besnoitia besnoiti]
MALSKQRDEVAQLVKFWSSTEGRDKSTKCLQYGSRTLASLLAARSPKAAAKIAALSGTASDGRKVFRLGKFLNEYVKLKALLVGFLVSRYKLAAASLDDTQKTQLLQLISRFGFLCYWVTDNLMLLSKIKVLGFDTKKLARLCGIFWLVGLLGALATEVRVLRRLRSLERDRLDRLEEERRGAEDAYVQGASSLRKIQQEKNASLLNIVKNASDAVVAANLAQIPHKLLGRPLDETTVGAAGFVSGAISCYQLYE